jgi:hypothetical protein
MRVGTMCFTPDILYPSNGAQGVPALLNHGDRAHLAFLEASPAVARD